MTLAAESAVITGATSTFTGPDDLLLDPSTNVIAVDIGGDTAGNTVNGVSFLNDGTGITGSVSNGGVTVSSTAGFFHQWLVKVLQAYIGGTPGSGVCSGKHHARHFVGRSRLPQLVSISPASIPDQSTMCNCSSAKMARLLTDTGT